MRNISVSLSDNASIPTRAHSTDAGFDLSAAEAKTIAPGTFALISSGVTLGLPEDVYVQVCSRSGLAAKKGVFVLNAPGIIDSGYRGVVGIVLMNAGEEEFVVNVGDRIAQLVFQRRDTDFSLTLVQEHEVAASVDTRDKSGFGSTGF